MLLFYFPWKCCHRWKWTNTGWDEWISMSLPDSIGFELYKSWMCCSPKIQEWVYWMLKYPLPITKPQDAQYGIKQSALSGRQHREKSCYEYWDFHTYKNTSWRPWLSWTYGGCIEWAWRNLIMVEIYNDKRNSSSSPEMTTKWSTFGQPVIDYK